MGRLIAVVGNSGVGKTTLVQALARAGSFVTGLEQHEERPFQHPFANNLQRYALPNQIDYLLYRAEQERMLRQQAETALIDGGLELDFYGFTQQFHHKGYLTDAEFALCERLYRTLRAALPPPDLFIYLTAPLEVVVRRYEMRGRPLEIARVEDLAQLAKLVEDWLMGETAVPVLRVDASEDDYCNHEHLQTLLNTLAIYD